MMFTKLDSIEKIEYEHSLRSGFAKNSAWLNSFNEGIRSMFLLTAGRFPEEEDALPRMKV